MNRIYGFNDVADIEHHFSARNVLDGCEVIFASYGGAPYTGDAFVLYRKDGQLYEVNGGHCSCYGLEGQWDAEETNVESLKQRFEKGSFLTKYDHDTSIRLSFAEVLKELEE